MNPSERALERSRQDLQAARHLAEGGFAAPAVSRAYYAALHGAEAALLALGETRSKQSGVIAAFGRLLVKEGELPEETSRILRSLFEQRGEADYGLAEVPAELADAAIRDPEVVVEAVTEWLRSRG